MYTPESISKKEFNIVHKGLDESQVRAYLKELSDEIERLKIDKVNLQKTIDDKQENIERFKAVENTIGEAMLVAQRAGEDTKAAARMQADIVIQDAKNHADQIVNDAMAKARDISFQTEDMKRQSKIFRARFKMLVEAQLDLLKTEDWDYLLNYDLETKPIDNTSSNDVE